MVGDSFLSQKQTTDMVSEVLEKRCRFFWQLDEIFGNKPASSRDANASNTTLCQPQSNPSPRSRSRPSSQPEGDTGPVGETDCQQSTSCGKHANMDDTPGSEDVQSVDIKAENKASPDAFTGGTTSSDMSISSPMPAPENSLVVSPDINQNPT